MRRKVCCTCGESDPNGPRHYKVVRMFMRPEERTRTIRGGLTLAEAKAHCQDTETSSRAATSSRARRYTDLHGPWFDGYDHE